MKDDERAGRVTNGASRRVGLAALLVACLAAGCGEGVLDPDPAPSEEPPPEEPPPEDPPPEEPPPGDPPPVVPVRRALCEEGFAGEFPCDRVDLVARVAVEELRIDASSSGEERFFPMIDIWGWTDPETGVEYVLVGRSNGVSIVDISTPVEPKVVAFMPSVDGVASSWRDIKVHANHAYVVAEIPRHGVQVLDLTRLRGLAEFAVLEADARYDGVSAVHNIAINEETGYAYAVGSSGEGDPCAGGLHMIDLADPGSPTFAGCHHAPTPGYFRSEQGYTHDVQCVVYRGPDTEHQGREVCFGANESHLAIMDVEDKQNPATLSVATYPDAQYVHQGWLSEDQRYFFQNDELDERSQRVDRTRLIVWDVADLDDPVVVTEHFGPTDAVDHNLYVRGDLIYHSNYAFGVRIIDVSNPERPAEAGYFDTHPPDNDLHFRGSWSVYPYFESGLFAATSFSQGVFILRLERNRN